ncbi:MAG: tetratricopeptide repeat protein, partial [Myxococcaceae bacterium]
MVALLCFTTPVLAQYRPPPATEAERYTQNADDLRADAAAKLAEGDKDSAQAQFKKAIGLYEKALSLSPRAVEPAVGLGAAANAVGEHKHVVKTLTAIQAAHPDDNGLAFQLGVALYKLKRYPEGIPLLEKAAVTSSSEFLLGHYYLATYYLQSQRGAAAVAQLVKYLQVRPPALASNDHEIHTLLGRAFVLWKKPKEARSSFERAQKGRPESVPIQMGLASVLELEGKTQDAVALLEGLVERNKKAPEPRERLGRLLLQAGQLERAEEVALELRGLSATAQSHLLLGEVRLARKQFKSAQGELEQAVKLASQWPPALIGLSRAYQQQARHDDAIALLERAASTGQLDVLAALGSANRRANRLQKAVEIHTKVREIAPNEARSHLLLGADYFATGEWDRAIESYTAAAALDAKSPAARHWLALALTHRARQRAEGRRVEEAVRDLRRAFDLERVPQIGRDLAIVLLVQ